jgi:hypothetical protein
MTWKPAGVIPGAPRALGAAADGPVWAVRDLSAVAGCRAGTPELLWTRALDPAASVIGPKLVALGDGVAVTVEDFGSRRPARVLALDAQSGEERWSRDLPLRLGTFGLAVRPGVVYVQGGEPDAEGIVYELDLETGSERAVVGLPDGNGVRAVGARVYAPTREGVFVLEDGTARQITTERARAVYGRGEDLYVHLDSLGGASVSAIVWLTGAEHREAGRFPGDAAVQASALLVPLATPGRLAVLAGEQSELVDVGAGTVTAPLRLEPGLVAVTAAAAGTNLVVLAQDAEFTQSVLTVDADGGAVTGRLEVEGELVNGNIAAEGDDLLVSGANLSFFEWVDA